MAEPDRSADELDGRTWLERLGEVPPPRRPWLPSALALVAGLACAVVAGLRVGGPGVVGALAAALVVVAFFASSAVPVTLTELLGAERALGLVVLLTNYALRVLLALVVLAALVTQGWADRAAAGLTVIVCGLVRVNAQAVLAGGDGRGRRSTR